jgi:Holliday junction resolvase RusA-like endonuclease
MTHLGSLSNVGLYDDDRQIKEIVYREVESSMSEYTVTLTSLM